MKLGLIIAHVVISVVLVAIVLMQHGKQQGLSGAIAGGAETFFGKNKGRTIDAMLKKFTAVFAVLFIISSIVLTAVSVNEYKGTETETATEATAEDGSISVQQDENGNLVDAEGNILMTAEEAAAATEGATEEAAEATETEAAETTEGAEAGAEEAAEAAETTETPAE